eukprot:1391291-Amphidinium_carterae.1
MKWGGRSKRGLHVHLGCADGREALEILMHMAYLYSKGGVSACARDVLCKRVSLMQEGPLVLYK